MTKRLAIIGKGTAGSLATTHFFKYTENCEIYWYYDSNTPAQSVGEGSSLILPRNLHYTLDLQYDDFEKINATTKLGIYKSGWGKTNKDFLHSFPLSYTAMHFNATKLQHYIAEYFSDKIQIIDKNVTADDIDADYVMVCSGKPNSYEEFNETSIPVNSAYITQCYWDYARFNYTLTIARPYGWVFGIPLQNRCSIGYLFNSDINNVDEVKKDVENVFEEYNLIPSETTNYLEFNNYYRKVNYTDRISYNGNASFFLEPLEATSIDTMDHIQRNSFSIWGGLCSVEESNYRYEKLLKEIETMVMLHYFSGSIYDTEFWRYAKRSGKEVIERSLREDENFINMINYVLTQKTKNLCDENLIYSTWWSGSFFENIEGLGIKYELLDILIKSQLQ